MLRPGVSFIVPFRVYMPEDFYTVKIDDRQVKIKPQALSPIEITQGPQVHGANIEFSHDIFGYAGRTLFNILLDQQVDVSTEEGKSDFAAKDKTFIRDAVIAVNRFLEVYRDQDQNSLGEKSFHIIPIVMAEVSDVRIVLVRDDDSEEQGICIRRPTLRPIGFGNATQRSLEIISSITDLLRDGTKIPIYRELLHSSMNAIWRSQYRLCPIESNTAFESFLSEITLLLEPLAVVPENLFDKLVLLESVLNQKLLSKSLAVISWFMPRRNGWGSLLDQILVDWKVKCYELRGKVIHEGYSQVTLREAQDSYRSSLGAINYIQVIVQKIL
ncbi:MAG: hypothetical protein Q8L26_01700 [Candidatus Omnitrophota bacterium]|nr:hypothetical protein [Candidatus Omnitrophota bacterium]